MWHILCVAAIYIGMIDIGTGKSLCCLQRGEVVIGGTCLLPAVLPSILKRALWFIWRAIKNWVFCLMWQPVKVTRFLQRETSQ